MRYNRTIIAAFQRDSYIHRVDDGAPNVIINVRGKLFSDLARRLDQERFGLFRDCAGACCQCVKFLLQCLYLRPARFRLARQFVAVDHALRVGVDQPVNLPAQPLDGVNDGGAVAVVFRLAVGVGRACGADCFTDGCFIKQ